MACHCICAGHEKQTCNNVKGAITGRNHSNHCRLGVRVSNQLKSIERRDQNGDLLMVGANMLDNIHCYEFMTRLGR